MGSGRGQGGGFGVPGEGIGSLVFGMGGRFPNQSSAFGRAFAERMGGQPGMMPMGGQLTSPVPGQPGMMPPQGMDAQMNAQRAFEAFNRDQANMFPRQPSATGGTPGMFPRQPSAMGGTPGMFPSQSAAMGAMRGQMTQGLGSLNNPTMFGGMR